MAGPAKPSRDRYDAVVTGAGFGGLGAALRLTELGARVLLCETLTYPGGCASTFERSGYSFESGATLFAGFGEGQFFRSVVDRYGLDVEVEALDPVVELRMPHVRLPVPREREGLLARLRALPGAPRRGLGAFFRLQEKVAESLWKLLDDPSRLPPFGIRALLSHAAELPGYARAARWAGRPVGEVLARHGLDRHETIRTFLDALCQITVQAGVMEAEAPFALAVMDYYFRGAVHVRGGIGRMARGLVEAIRRNGGEVLYTSRVEAVEPHAGGFRVRGRNWSVRADRVLANVLPRAARKLLGVAPGENRRLDRLGAEVETGWGACMLYLVLEPGAGFPDGPHHLQIVQDPEAPLVEGNHLFCSVGGGARPGEPGDRSRAVTVSAHVPMAKLRALSPPERGVYVGEIQARMRRGIERFAPEVHDAIVFDMTASPRTFERFTGRPGGFVGGIPRRAGRRNYRDLFPRPVVPGFYLVGDTCFPGQSTLATAIGGTKVAEHAARGLSLPPVQLDGVVAGAGRDLEDRDPVPPPVGPLDQQEVGAGRRVDPADGPGERLLGAVEHEREPVLVAEDEHRE
jgi:phytoene dehydrogenase-like protein